MMTLRFCNNNFYVNIFSLQTKKVIIYFWYIKPTKTVSNYYP